MSLLPSEVEELLVGEDGTASGIVFLNAFKDINVWTGVRIKGNFIVERIGWNVGAVGAVWVRTWGFARSLKLLTVNIG